jgi:type III secretion protein R
MGLTAFVKISTVLFITRGAIGMPAVPSSLIVMTLATALTTLAMLPVGRLVSERALPVLEQSAQKPLEESAPQALEAVREPLRKFYFDNASSRERGRFFELAKRQGGASVSEKDFSVLIPAFLVTELLEAFALGFAIFLPFLVIDLVVSNLLVTLGLSALSPQQIALPLKLLLFVALDGWGLLSESLVKSYAVG